MARARPPAAVARPRTRTQRTQSASTRRPYKAARSLPWHAGGGSEADRPGTAAPARQGFSYEPVVSIVSSAIYHPKVRRGSLAQHRFIPAVAPHHEAPTATDFLPDGSTSHPPANRRRQRWSAHGGQDGWTNFAGGVKGSSPRKTGRHAERIVGHTDGDERHGKLGRSRKTARSRGSRAVPYTAAASGGRNLRSGDPDAWRGRRNHRRGRRNPLRRRAGQAQTVTPHNSGFSAR